MPLSENLKQALSSKAREFSRISVIGVSDWIVREKQDLERFFVDFQDRLERAEVEDQQKILQTTVAYDLLERVIQLTRRRQAIFEQNDGRSTYDTLALSEMLYVLQDILLDCVGGIFLNPVECRPILKQLEISLRPSRSCDPKADHEVINQYFLALRDHFPEFQRVERVRASIQTNGSRFTRWLNPAANPGDRLTGSELFSKIKKNPPLAGDILRDRGWFGGKNLWQELTGEQIFQLFAMNNWHVNQAIQANTNSVFRSKLREGLQVVLQKIRSNRAVLIRQEFAGLELALQSENRVLFVRKGILWGERSVDMRLIDAALKQLPAVTAAAAKEEKEAKEAKFSAQTIDPGFSELDAQQQKDIVEYLVAEIKTYLQTSDRGPSATLFGLLTHNDDDLFTQIDRQMQQQDPTYRFWFLKLIELRTNEQISGKLKKLANVLYGAATYGKGIFAKLKQDQQQEAAATTLQSHWRGRQSRKVDVAEAAKISAVIAEFNRLWTASLAEGGAQAQAQADMSALLADPVQFELLKTYYSEHGLITFANRLGRLVIVLDDEKFLKQHEYIDLYLSEQRSSPVFADAADKRLADSETPGVADAARKRMDARTHTAAEAPRGSAQKSVVVIIQELVDQLPMAFEQKSVGLPHEQAEVLAVLAEPKGEIDGVNVIQSLLGINAAVTEGGTCNSNWAQTWSSSIGKSGSQLAGLLLKLHQRLTEILPKQQAAEATDAGARAVRGRGAPRASGSPARMFAPPQPPDPAAGVGRSPLVPPVGGGLKPK